MYQSALTIYTPQSDEGKSKGKCKCKGKSKGKFFPSLNKYHEMNACWGSGGITPLIF